MSTDDSQDTSIKDEPIMEPDEQDTFMTEQEDTY